MSGFHSLGEDDDLDFSGGGSSKLANLFGIDTKSSDGGNQSLTYTAPKQPRKESVKETEKSQSGALVCLHAVPVNAFKLVNGQYVNQGKVGGAVLGNHDKSIYNVILYKGKQQTIAMASISPSFKLTIQANNYANFYDDQRQNWSILFESLEKNIAFAKNVALAIANSSGVNMLKEVIIQDLIPGDGNGLENSDSAEMNYTGWLMTNHSFGKVFDENKNKDKPFRVKLGKGKVIKGWEEGLIGAKKGCCRLLIIPPNLAYGTQGMGNRIPPNSTLIFEIDINKVKLSKDKNSSSRSETPQPSDQESAAENKNESKPSIPVKPRTQSVENIRARGESITEQLSTSPKSNKAKIISRMAKMGQPMIPLEGAIPVQPSDESSDEIEEPAPETNVSTTLPASISPKKAAPVTEEPKPVGVSTTDHYQRVVPQAKPVEPQAVHVSAPPQHQLSVYQSNPYSQHSGMMVGGAMGYAGSSAFQQPPVLQSQYLPIQQVQSPAPINDNHNAMLLSETRTQNTEIRLNLSKLSDKVDSVVSTLHEMKMNRTSSIVPTSGLPTLEPTIMLHSITKIVQENSSLRTELEEKRTKMEAQSEKISELLHRNQRFIEQSNDMFERKNDSLQSTALESQARLFNIEKEKNLLAYELNEARSKLNLLQDKLLNKEEVEKELRSKLGGKSSDSMKNIEELSQLKEKSEESEQQILALQQSIRKEKQGRRDDSLKLSSLEDTIADLKSSNTNLEKSISERKQKMGVQRKEFEQQIEELKSLHEEELQSLQSRLSRKPSSSQAQEVENIEKELNERWQLKCDKLLADSKKQYEQEIRNMIEQQDELLKKSMTMESKLQKTEQNEASSHATISKLQNEIGDLANWKVKYDNLHSNVIKMKQKYEERIQEIESNSHDSAEMMLEVKKVMNAVYKQLQDEVEVEDSYTGKEVLGTVLNVIRETTIQYLEKHKAESERQMDNSDENDSESVGVDEVDEQKDNKHDQTRARDEGSSRINDNSNQKPEASEEPKDDKDGVSNTELEHNSSTEISSEAHDVEINEKYEELDENIQDVNAKSLETSQKEEIEEVHSATDVRSADPESSVEDNVEVSNLSASTDAISKTEINADNLAEKTGTSADALTSCEESSNEDKNKENNGKSGAVPSITPLAQKSTQHTHDIRLKPPSPPPLWSDDDEDEESWLA